MGTYNIQRTRTPETKLDRVHKVVGVKCGVSVRCEASESRMVSLCVAQKNAREEVDRLRINAFVIFFTLHDKICSI